MKRRRLGNVLVERGLARSEEEAFIIVTEGRVFVNGQKAISPAQMVGEADQIEIQEKQAFVGRGAVKLQAAIKHFRIDVRDTICADIGSATGGFVEVLLRHGARKVYAIDVGHGKLELKLREDPRVVVMEETNVLSLDSLPEPVDLVTIDVSFTSLRLVLPKIRSWFTSEGKVIALFKPQYELSDKTLLKHGVVADPKLRGQLLAEFREWLKEHGWHELGFMESPIRGSEGNVEYLFHLSLNDLSARTYIAVSPGRGRGVFAKERIAAGECFDLFRESWRLLPLAAVQQFPRPHRALCCEYAFDGRYAVCPVDFYNPPLSHLINHSCEPNLVSRNNYDTIFALCTIERGSELTFDYATFNTGTDEFDCTCGASACRGRVTGNDWMIPELQERYRGYFQKNIQEKINALGLQRFR